MPVWGIIPVKPLKLAKSRLSRVITPEQREQLAEAMLRHVLEVMSNVPQVNGTLVISRDNRALAIAREYGANTVQESGAPELNAALMRATQVVGGWGGEAVLILPADLPFLHANDILAMLALGQRFYGEPTVVVATDRNEDGTNALYVSPPGLLNYSYGVGSYHRHVVQARDARANIEKYVSERLLWDIDVPEDLMNYLRMIERGAYQALSFLSEAQMFDLVMALKEAGT